jgi:hypothetical protein
MPTKTLRAVIRWCVLPVSVVVALGVGCQCVSATVFKAPDIARLSSCLAPDRIASLGATSQPTPVAWVGRYQRTNRHADFVELEYRFVEVSNLTGLLSSARRGEPLAVDLSATHDTKQVFFVRIDRAMAPERWPELSSPWSMALWAGDASRVGSQTLLQPKYQACEIQGELPPR